MSAWTKEELEKLLFDVVAELDLSDGMMEEHGPLGTEPAKLVRLVMDRKDLEIRMLKQGFVSVGNSHPEPTSEQRAALIRAGWVAPCEGCNGRGEVGRMTQEGGESWPCPFCAVPAAYLHQVVCGDGEPDQALSFVSDSFPFQDVSGYRSLSHEPLYRHPSVVKDSLTPDPIVESVVAQMRERSRVGIAKYGVGMDRTDLTPVQWAHHAQEEALDLALYLERVKSDLSAYSALRDGVKGLIEECVTGSLDLECGEEATEAYNYIAHRLRTLPGIGKE